MTHRMLALGFVVFVALVVAAPSLSFGASFGTAPADPYVKEIDCSETRNATHEFFRDGRAHYALPGQCQVKKSDGQTVTLRYYVDGNWTPGAKGFATEIGRIYDLGNVLPQVFQPGPPGTYTPFIVRLFCESDPWLNDARCGLEYASGVDELAKWVSRFSSGPFPLTKGAIPASQRAALLAEYKRATEQVVAVPFAVGKKDISPFLVKPPQAQPQPPQPNAPYGATYRPNAIANLTRNQTVAVSVQVTNTGGLTWTPSGANPFRLSYHWYQGTKEVVRNGLRTNLPGVIAFTQSTNPPLSASVRAPSTPGTYILRWDMVQEGVTYFRDKGVPTGDQTVIVK